MTISKTKRLSRLYFTGNATKQEICWELSSLPKWAGRKHHLAELPLAGNGEITMKDKATGKTIYRTSFSSLFQEWVSEEEANRIKKDSRILFFYISKGKAIVTISLKMYIKVNASLTHEIVPNDILIINDIPPSLSSAKRKYRRLYRCSNHGRRIYRKRDGYIL